MVDDRLIETIKAIEAQDDSGEAIKIINTVANLVFEALDKRKTGATYSRIMGFNNLTVDIKYGCLIMR